MILKFLRVGVLLLVLLVGISCEKSDEKYPKPEEIVFEGKNNGFGGSFIWKWEKKEYKTLEEDRKELYVSFENGAIKGLNLVEGEFVEITLPTNYLRVEIREWDYYFDHLKDDFAVDERMPNLINEWKAVSGMIKMSAYGTEPSAPNVVIDGKETKKSVIKDIGTATLIFKDVIFEDAKRNQKVIKNLEMKNVSLMGGFYTK